MQLNNFYHDFFYQEGKVRRSKRLRIRFNDKSFYSFNTTIGFKANLKGKKYLFLSSNDFSQTTRRHIDNLRLASPLPIIYVPFTWYDCFDTQENLIKEMKRRYEESLDNCLSLVKDIKYTRKGDRENFNILFEQALNFNNLAVRLKGISKADKALCLINSSEYQKEKRAEVRKEATKKAVHTKEVKEKAINFFKRHSYMECVKYVFQGGVKKNKELAGWLKEYLLSLYPTFTPSFVWVEESKIKTSQGIEIEVKDIIPILMLWSLRSNINGMLVNGKYSILANTAERVQVGCHNIPQDNVKNLAIELGVM